MRKPAFQPAGTRILTPGICVTSTPLGYATLQPHQEHDRLAMTTTAEDRNKSILAHWAAIRAGQTPSIDKVPAAGGPTVSGAQLKAELMGSSLVLGTSNHFADGLTFDAKPRRQPRREGAAAREGDAAARATIAEGAPPRGLPRRQGQLPYGGALVAAAAATAAANTASMEATNAARRAQASFPANTAGFMTRPSSTIRP